MCNVLIAGGGLAGVTLAYTLQKNLLAAAKSEQGKLSVSIQLCEATDRLGGRAYESAGIDLGGAWLWPGSETLFRLCRELNVKTVAQESGGGERRIHGGVSLLIERMRAAIEETNANPEADVKVEFKFGHQLRSAREESASDGPSGSVGPLSLEVEHVDASQFTKDFPAHDTKRWTLSGEQAAEGGGDTRSDEKRSVIQADFLAVAIPPAKAAGEIDFQPSDALLGAGARAAVLLQRMRDQPVWMAPLGKLALFYPAKFWTAGSVGGGLRFPVAGAGMRGGVQVYDAGETTDGSGLHTIVAFVCCGDTEEELRTCDSTVLAEIVTQQLWQKAGWSLRQKVTTSARSSSCIRVADTSNPFQTQLHSHTLKCWRTDKSINELSAASAFPEHPRPVAGLNNFQDPRARLFFCNSEASDHFTGMLEGAAWNAAACAREIQSRILK